MSKIYNSKGFSLIEVLVSIAILTISLMALMSITASVMRNNVKNEVRNKAVETLRNNINSMSAGFFDNLSSETDNCSLKVRNFSIDNCTIIDNVTFANNLSDTKKIEGTIKWKFMGQNFSYTINTFISK